MSRLQRYSIRALLLLVAVTAVLAATVSQLRHGYHRGRAAILNLGGDVAFHPRGECGEMLEQGWRFVGEYIWTGPQILERPMRDAGIPWFDRISALYVFDYDAQYMDNIGKVLLLSEMRTLYLIGEVTEADLTKLRAVMPRHIEMLPI